MFEPLIDPTLLCRQGHDMCWYELDHLEEWTMDGGTALYIRRFIPTEQQEALYESSPRRPGHVESIVDCVNHYQDAFDKMVDEICDDWAAGNHTRKMSALIFCLNMSLATYLHMPERVAEDVLYELSHKARKGRRLSKREKVIRLPTKKVARRLLSPEATRKHFKRNAIYRQYGEMAHRVERRWKKVFNTLGKDDLAAGVEKYNINVSILNNYRTSLVNPAHVATMLNSRARAWKRDQKKKRRPLIRALRMLEQVAGPGVVKDFMKYEPYEFDFHPDYRLSVELRDAYALDWSGVTVRLFTKTNVHITNLCVYFEKTPAPEQLVGWILHYRTGIINKLLEAANVASLSNSDLWNKFCDDLSLDRKRATIINPNLFPLEPGWYPLANTELEQRASQQWETLYRKARPVVVNVIRSRLPNLLKRVVTPQAIAA